MAASQFADLVKVNTATTGTGTMTLGSAVSGFVGTTPLTDGALYSYAIQDTGGAYEFGQGTYTASGMTLARTTIYGSSNSGSAINLSGSAVVLITALKEDFKDFGRLRLLGKLASANFNSTADQAITLYQPGTGPWVVAYVLLANPSTSISTAKGGIYAAASKTNAMFGTTTTTIWVGLAASTDAAQLALANSNFGSHFVYFTGTSTTIYLSLTTPQGGAATVDIYVFGYDLS